MWVDGRGGGAVDGWMVNLLVVGRQIDRLVGELGRKIGQIPLRVQARSERRRDLLLL